MWQTICLGMFFAFLLSVFFHTKGRIEWNALRVYLQFEYVSVYCMFIQMAGYLIICLVKELQKNLYSLVSKKQWSCLWMVFCFALLILLNLWIFHFCIEEIHCDSLYMNRIYSDLLLWSVLRQNVVRNWLMRCETVWIGNEKRLRDRMYRSFLENIFRIWRFVL